jgi:Uma2 family endonuclease
MAAFQPKKIYNIEDYLELERTSEEKFEFWDGNVWSMSGASTSHNRIVRNLNTQIDIQLSEKGCESFPSDMRIKVPAYPPYRYPDISALCGIAEIESIGQIEMLTNPQLIIEVLSESTEAFDRGDKFSYYKSIESFSEYLLIAQHRPHISQFVKQGDGFWINSEVNSLDEIIELKSVPCKLQLSLIYRGVDFEPVESR